MGSVIDQNKELDTIKIANIRSLITRNIKTKIDGKDEILQYLIGSLEFVDKYNKLIEITNEDEIEVFILWDRDGEKIKELVYSKLDDELLNRVYFDKPLTLFENDIIYKIYASINGKTGYVSLVDKQIFSKEKDYKIIIENSTIRKAEVTEEEREKLEENQTTLIKFEELNKDVDPKEIAIKVKNVSKSFTVFFDKANSFKDRLLFLGRNKRKEDVQILNDINLTIKKGEIVGLIGVNGSRKEYIIKTYDTNYLSK